MQTNKTPANRAGSYDADVLQASNVSGFKAWLIRHGYQVTAPSPADAKKGVIYWVVLTSKKSVCVREGRGVNNRYVETHHMLRGFLDRFLANPVASAVKSVVRPAHAAPRLPAVRSVTVAPLALKKPQPAQNDESQSAGKFLVSAELIQAAMARPAMDSGDESHHVIGVRVGGSGNAGRTVVTRMVVHGNDGSQRQLEVLEHVLVTDSGDLPQIADAINAAASKLDRCTVLVDMTGAGSQLFELLSKTMVPGAKRFGLMLGLAPGGADNKRFINQRSQCAVRAAAAFKRGAVKLIGTASDVNAYGGQLPFHFDEHARYRVERKAIRKANPDQHPDLFEAMSLAFAPIDFANPPPAVQATPAPAPTPAPAATTGKVNEYLTDLRDDFAVHCPLTQEVGEAMTAFVDRCWEYANLMVKRRPTPVRG